MRNRWSLMMVAACVVVTAAACNPLISAPVDVGAGNEIEVSAVRYSGPPGVWLEAAATGAPGRVVYASALIPRASLTGPVERSCGGITVAPCEVNVVDVRSQQRVLPQGGSAFARLMTIWPDETIQIVVVCVEPVTQELGCPPSLRLTLQARNEAGTRTGDLLPGAVLGP